MNFSSASNEFGFLNHCKLSFFFLISPDLIKNIMGTCVLKNCLYFKLVSYKSVFSAGVLFTISINSKM